MYNDPSGEFFVFLGLGVLFWKAVIIGAAVGLASYTVGLAVTGNLHQWNIGGALKATLWGAVSGAVTFGIGSIFNTAAGALTTTGNAIKEAIGGVGLAMIQAGTHAVAQGVMSLMQGGSFEQAFWSGALGSLGASGWNKMFGTNGASMIAFGALSGGIGAELSGGNFWEGAVIGGMVAGLNHAMHSEQAQPDPPQEDDWYTKFVNFISGGAIDEARAILAFEATNPSFGEKIMFRTGIALQNSTAETFGAKGLGAWGNYRGGLTNHLSKSFSVKTANGIKIRGFTKHAIHRSIQRNVKTAGILDAVKNPIKINNVMIDNLGRPSQTFIGGKGTVVVNPQTGQIISVYPTSSRRVKKYSK